MPEWYIVKYSVGKEFDEMLIYAHEEKEAERIALIQLRQTKRRRGKIVSISKEGEKSEEEKNWEKTLVFKIN